MLIVLEAMQMEPEISAPVDGTVIDIPENEGDEVGEEDVLCILNRAKNF